VFLYRLSTRRFYPPSMITYIQLPRLAMSYKGSKLALTDRSIDLVGSTSQLWSVFISDSEHQSLSCIVDFCSRFEDA
jgi:hypothetical protein